MKKVTNDHRSRVTKMLIRKAFMELLRQKPLASISVKELCELAGINRGTFYSHYQDVYDLLWKSAPVFSAAYRTIPTCVL